MINRYKYTRCDVFMKDDKCKLIKSKLEKFKEKYVEDKIIDEINN